MAANSILSVAQRVYTVAAYTTKIAIKSKMISDLQNSGKILFNLFYISFYVTIRFSYFLFTFIPKRFGVLRCCNERLIFVRPSEPLSPQ